MLLAVPRYAIPEYALPTYALAGDYPEPPAAPSGMAATADGANRINTAWVDNAADVAGVNEVQTITFNVTPEAGTFTLTYDAETTAAIDWDANAAAIVAALEATAAFEVGDVSVDRTGNVISITYQGGLAAMSLPEITADSALKQAADGIDITVTQSGIADAAATPSINTTTAADSGVTSQVDTITFSATPVAGSMTIDGQSLAYDANASTLTISGASATGTPASGAITITWNDTDGHTPVSIAVDTLLSVQGRPHVFTVTLSDSPTEGTWQLNNNSASGSGYIAATASAAEIEAEVEAMAGGYPCTVSGSSGGPWTITSVDHVGDESWNAAEIDPLRKAVSITIDTDTEGSPQQWDDLGSEVHRSTDGVSYSLLVDLGANMESWPDETCSASSLYYYKVRAYNAGGYSAFSNVDSDTTDAAAEGGGEMSKTIITIGVSI